MIDFFVPGIPVPQGRARAFTRPGMKGVRFYDPKKSKGWKEIVAWEAHRQMTAERLLPSNAPLKLYCWFALKAPKDRGPNHHHDRKPDLDNLVKAVKDALKGVCWQDDSQVCILVASKNYALPGEEGVRIKIERA